MRKSDEFFINKFHLTWHDIISCLTHRHRKMWLNIFTNRVCISSTVAQKQRCGTLNISFAINSQCKFVQYISL